VIVGDTSANAPDGFLRKVTSVSNNAGEIVVQTAPATIDEAVEQGEVSVRQVLQPTNLERATFAKGVRMVQSPDEPSSFHLELNNVVLYDQDGNENTTDDQINGNGSVGLDSTFEFRLKVEDSNLKELYFTATTSEASQPQAFIQDICHYKSGASTCNLSIRPPFPDDWTIAGYRLSSHHNISRHRWHSLCRCLNGRYANSNRNSR